MHIRMTRCACAVDIAAHVVGLASSRLLPGRRLDGRHGIAAARAISAPAIPSNREATSSLREGLGDGF